MLSTIASGETENVDAFSDDYIQSGETSLSECFQHSRQSSITCSVYSIIWTQGLVTVTHVKINGDG